MKECMGQVGFPKEAITVKNWIAGCYSSLQIKSKIYYLCNILQ